MLYAQIKHPVTLVTLLFLLVAGSAVRWNEYRLPWYARSVNMTAVALAKRVETPVDAKSADVVRLYEEASQLLDGYKEDDPGYTLLDHIGIRYFSNQAQDMYDGFTLPKTFFSKIRPDLEAYLNQRQDVLALLYRVAELPPSSNAVLRDPEVRRSSSRSQDHAIVQLLLQDALRHAIDHNGTGALRAITGLDAFIRAQERFNPLRGRGREMLGSWLSGLVLGYGIEAGVFNDESLDILEKVFTYEEDPGGRVIRWHRLSGKRKSTYWYPPPGAFWYELRFSSRNSMKEMIIFELLLKSLSDAELWIDHDILFSIVQRAFITTYFIQSQSEVIGPYSVKRDRSYVYINCGFRDILEDFLVEYRGVQVRTALRTVIALEKHHRRTGAFPDSLDALTPADISPELLHMARNMIDYWKTQQGWELRDIREVPEGFVPDLLYRYPLLTPEE